MFDLNAVDPAYSAALRGNMIGSIESDFLKMFKPEVVNNLSGDIPYIPSKHAYRLGGRPSKIQIAKGPTAGLGGLETASFRFIEKFGARSEISKHIVEGMGRINSAEKLMAYLVDRNKAQIAGDIDADGATYLKAVAQTVTATAAFSNTSTARFITDMDAMSRKVPKFNFIVIGETEAQEICKLPFLTTSTGNFSGAEMTAGYEELNAWLRKRYNTLEDVWIGSSYYNSNGEGQALAIANDYDGVFVAGDKEAVIPCEWTVMNEFNGGYIPGAQIYFEEAVVWSTIATGDASRLVRLAGF